MKLSLDESAPVPLYQQIYQQIRELILQGTLRPGSRLLSSRELARQVGVGRVPVTTAYEQLLAEGYGQATTKAGKPCRNRPVADSAYCRIHQPG